MGSESQIGDFVTLRRGTTYKGALVGEPGPALLGLGSIVPGGGFRGDFKTYGGDCPPGLMLTPGNLYVSLKGATKDGEMIGSVARVPDDVQSGRLTQDTVGLMFLERDPTFERYLYWLLRTPQYRNYCAGRATGSAVVALSREDFLSYPVPQLTVTRRRIVAVLESLEDLIESNRRAAALALQIPIAELSYGGETVRVGDIADVQKGLSYKGAGLNEGTSDEAVGMINLANFTRTGAMKFDSLKYYTDEFKPKHVLSAWDLVLANTDLTQSREILGRGFIVPPNLDGVIHTHHTSVVRFRERSELSLVLWAQLQSPEFRDRAMGFATGTTVTALPPEAVLDFKLCVPEDLEARLRRARKLLEHSFHSVAESDRLIALRDTLLSELSLGRVRVRDLADLVVEARA